MRIRSITRQTVTIVLLAQITFAIGLAATAVLSEHSTRMRALSQQVAGRSDSLLGAIQDAEDVDSDIQIDPAELRLPSHDRYAVYSSTGKLIGRSEEAGPPLPMNGPEGESSLKMGGETFTVLRRGALRVIDRAKYGREGLRKPVVLVYASSQRHVLHEVSEAIGMYVSAIVIASILVAVSTAVLLRRALRPIRDLAFAAQQVTPASLQFHAPATALRLQELRPLAETLSSLIEELREAFAKEQRFVSDAAHELKTAVAVVRSSIQLMMMRHRDDHDYSVQLEQLLQDNGRVEELVAGMLELARLEQANQPAASADLALAAHMAVATMQPIAEHRAVQLNVDAPSQTMVQLHPDLAHTLLTNLLSNAIRHSHGGGCVRVRVTAARDGVVRLYVEDDGQGIRPEALPHVFERFYRDDPSRARTSGGTGLGLAICKSIVESAGGSITIESSFGRGATVLAAFIAA